MILRGVSLSEKRVSLEAVSPVRAVPSPARGPNSPPREASGLARDSAEPPARIVEVRIEPAPMTQSTVSDWLKTCDESARAAVAVSLADDLHALRTQAQSEGFAAGQAAGLEDAVARVKTTLAALERCTAAAEAAFATEEAQLAGQCADIVMAALGKIAGPVLSRPEAVTGCVMEVLKRVKDERELTIRVSPYDLAVLQENRDRIAQALAGRTFSILEDKRVELGGCVVESALGTLDGRLEQQLHAMYDTVRDAKGAAS